MSKARSTAELERCPENGTNNPRVSPPAGAAESVGKIEPPLEEWVVVWPGGCQRTETPTKDSKITGSLPFGTVFRARATPGDPYLALENKAGFVRGRPTAGGPGPDATFAIRSSVAVSADQYIVTGHGEANLFQRAQGRSPVGALPKGWRLLALERGQEGWFRHQLGWSYLEKGMPSSNATTRPCLSPASVKTKISGAQVSQFYPLSAVAASDGKRQDSKGSQPTTTHQPAVPEHEQNRAPPRPGHRVQAYRGLRIDRKRVDKMVNVKKTKRRDLKAICGTVACLLSADSSAADWHREYLALFASQVGLPDADVKALTPLLSSRIEPEAFLSVLSWKPSSNASVTDPSRARLPLVVLHHSVLRMGYYDARIRILLRSLCRLAGIPTDLFCRYEDVYCSALRSTIQASQDAKERRKQNWKWRWMKIGLFTVGGGAITALTAGAAAPFVGAGLMALGGGTAVAGAGAFLATGAGATLFGTLFGVTAGGMIGYKVDNRIADVKEFEFIALSDSARPDSETGSMSAVLCIGGWHSDAETPRDELQEHWGHQFAPRFAPGKEVYGLLWESAELAAFGNALSDMAKRQVTGYAVGKGLAYTALGSIIAAVAFPLFVVEVAGLIDNAYSVALARADKAALILADAIKNRVQGRRPLTIVACSLGARVVFEALRELARQRDQAATDSIGGGTSSASGDGKKAEEDERSERLEDPKAIIMDVFLMGAPVAADSETWSTVRSCVAGRLVNIYSSADWILRLLVRSNELALSLAGIQEVSGVPGVENVDVSEMVGNHFGYGEAMVRIMERVGFMP